MSDPVRLGQSDFIRECQRLHEGVVAALRTHDIDTIDAANEAFVHFLRMNRAGRLQEYFANRAAEAQP